MLCVFLSQAFNCIGHESYDHDSRCVEMHVCTDWTLVCTVIGER